MEKQSITTEEIKNDDKYTPRRVVTTTTETLSAQSDIETQTNEFRAKKAIFRTYQIAWFLLGIVETLLIFRVFLRLIGASLASGFTQAIYSLSGPFALPFRGIVRDTISGVSIMEWSTLIAMAFYVAVVWGFIEFLQIVKPVKPKEVEQGFTH